MPFISPGLDELCDSIANLRKHYRKNNPLRLKNIAYLEKMAQIENVSKEKKLPILLGACIFVLEKIQEEYRLSNAEECTVAGFFTKGSSLYKLINSDCLESIEDKKLTEDYKFAYLTSFYKYVEAQPHHLDDVESKEEDSSQVIVSQTKNMLIRLIINSRLAIDILMKSPPCRKYLLDNFENIPSAYRAVRETGGRVQDVAFLEILNKRVKPLNIMDGDQKSEGVNDPEKNVLDYEVRYGASLYYLKRTQKRWPLSESLLHRLVREASNVDSLDEVDDEVAKKYLSSLINYIKKLNTPEEVARWEKDGLKNPPAFFENLLKHAVAQFNEISDPKRTSTTYLGITASFLGVYGVQLMMSAVFKKAVSDATVLSIAGKVLGTVVNSKYKLLAAISTSLAPFMMPALAAEIKDRIACLFASYTSPLVVSGIYGSVDTVRRVIFNNVNFVMTCNERNPLWIQALYDLPNDIFPDEFKDRLKRVVPQEQLPALIQNFEAEIKAKALEAPEQVASLKMA